MSLDKWIKPEKKKPDKKNEDNSKNTPQKNSIKVKSTSKKKETQSLPETKTRKITKFVLICPKKTCGYQKTLMKKELSEKDKICPRCKGNMKIKQ